MHAKYFSLINLNMILKSCAIVSFSLILILFDYQPDQSVRPSQAGLTSRHFTQDTLEIKTFGSVTLIIFECFI